MYNDDYMIYDERTHRYELTEKAVFDNLGENLDMILQSGSKTAFLKRVSSVVYNYIYAASQSPEYIEYIMAKDDGLRDTIFEMLLRQAEYTLVNGAVDSFSGVNIAKQQAMPLSSVRGEAKISDITSELANRILPRYGHSLRYAGKLPYICAAAYRAGY